VTAQSVAPERLPLVGRAPVIEAILAASSRARHGGGTVLILGAAGLGKSAVLSEVVAQLSGWTVLRVAADRVESELPYSTIETMTRVLNLRLSERAEPPAADTDPAAVGRSILQAIDRLPAPVCLIIDDAQWVDAASAKTIRFVMRRLAEQPFLIVAAARARAGRRESLVADLSEVAPDHVVLNLGPLTVANTQELANNILGHRISRRTAARLTESTHGSPLMLGALLEQMRESFAVALHPAGWDAPLPSNTRLASAISVALESSSAEVRRAAEIVAVLRDPIPAPMLGTIAARLGLELDTSAAVQLGLVRAVERDGVTWFEPTDAMVADALIAEIPLATRQSVHREAADLLSGRRALRHRVESASHTDPRLVLELLAAGHEAADVGDNTDAVNYARAAVSLAPAGDLHDQALIDAGLLAMRTRSQERIFDLLVDLEALPPSLTRDIILLELRTLTGNMTGAFALAASIAAAPDDSAAARAIKAHAACDLPMIQMATRQFAPVPEQIEHARHAIARAPADPGEIAEPALRWIVQPREDTLRVLSWLMTAAAHLARTDLIEEAIDEVDRLAAEGGGSPALVDAFVTRGRTFILTGDLVRARVDLEHAKLLIDEHPASWTASHGRTMLAHVLYLLGDWDGSLALADDAVALALDETDLSGWPLALTVSTLVRAGRGDEKPVEERLTTAHNARSGLGGPYDGDLPHIARAELARARHRPAEQLAAANAGRRSAAASSTMGWLTYEIDALTTLGRAAEARLALAECEHPSSRWHPYYGSRAWLTGRVLEAEGRLSDARASYRKACDDPESALYPLPLAVALVDHARVLAALGEIPDAIASLSDALAIFGRLGAIDYLVRTTAELERLEGLAQANSGDAPTTSFDLLTARERQVAQALAAGMTNKEIAERLYVSVTTVNFHVRNILAKLGLRSRRELRRMPTSPRSRPTQPARHDDWPQGHRPVKS
jgi:DNA-binding CsgD family transcriptional regulator